MQDHRLRARNTGNQRILHISRQAGRNAVRIDRMIIKSFRLKKHLMGFAIGKTLYLILDGRAVARSLLGDLAAIDCGQAGIPQ